MRRYEHASGGVARCRHRRPHEVAAAAYVKELIEAIRQVPRELADAAERSRSSRSASAGVGGWSGALLPQDDSDSNFDHGLLLTIVGQSAGVWACMFAQNACEL